MPRYYFDTDDGHYQHHDDEGVQFADVEAARKEAIRALTDIAQDALPDGDRRDFTSSVRTEAGQVLFRAKLSLVAEWVGADDR